MREIKFRAWFYGQKKMLNDLDIKTIGTTFSFPLNWCELMQYTGLKDKNGKEIYEGDLCLLYDRYNGLPATGCAKVIFSYAYVGGWVLTSDKGELLNIGTRTSEIEVIGNIYENPELIK